MGSTTIRRVVVGVILLAVVGVWATTHLNQTKHYSDSPGQGATLQRMSLPPLDASAGGPIALPDPGSGSPAVHQPAQQAAVQPAPGAPPAVPATRAPDATPQDPQVANDAGTGSAVSEPMPGTAGFDASLLTNLLPVCDAACLTRVLANLGVTVPPVTLPVTLPVGTTP